jgi:predicted peroxiredoxin
MANKRHRRTKKRVRESRKEMEGGGLFDSKIRSKINAEADGKYFFKSDEDSNVKIQQERQAKIEKVRSVHSKAQLTGVLIMICTHIYDTYIAERDKVTEHDIMYFSNDLARFIKKIMTILNGYHELLNDVFYTDGAFPVFDKETLSKFVINPVNKKGYIYGKQEALEESNTGLPYNKHGNITLINEQLAKVEKFNVFFKCYKPTEV